MAGCVEVVARMVISTAASGPVDDKPLSSLVESGAFQSKPAKSEKNYRSEIVSDKPTVPDRDELLCLQHADGNTGLAERLDDVEKVLPEDDSFIPPDSCVISDIISQVEYYFSDANLPNDKFLLQQISRDKYGFVALSVIATFKRMKKLTADIRVIAYAIRQSLKLEVSKNGTRVRRIHTLPTESEKLSRMVVAVNLQDPTVLKVQQDFSVYGTVAHCSVICRGEFVTGADVRRQVRGGLDSFGKAVTGIALVEFCSQDHARMACERMTDGGNWRHGLHVSMLSLTTGKKQISKQKDHDSHDKIMLSVNNVTECSSGVEGSLKKLRNAVYLGTSDQSCEIVSHSAILDKNICSGTHEQLISKRNSGCSSKQNPNQVHVDSAQSKSHAPVEDTGCVQNSPKGISPWVQRRLKASQVASDCVDMSPVVDCSVGSTVAGSKKMSEALWVIRQPRGPDGSRGFCMNRSKIELHL